jgi:glutathione S-transferase
MKLYYSLNLNPRVAVAVARHLDSPVNYVFASPRDPDHEEAFRQINPNTLVPVLVEGGKVWWEADAIACRLSQIAGSDFWAAGQALPETVKWLSWNKRHLTLAGEAYYFENIIKPRYLGLPPDPGVIREAEGEFHRYSRVLDDILASRRWLIEDRLSYADFRTASIMPFASDAKMPVDGYKNILRWADRLDEIDAWREPFKGLSSRQDMRNLPLPGQ